MSLSKQYADTAEKPSTATIETPTCDSCDERMKHDSTRGEWICHSCGRVARVSKQNIDYGPEWTSYDDEQDKSRVGPPRTISRHNNGLGTMIGYAGESTRQLRRIKKHHKRLSPENHHIRDALSEIKRIVSQGELPNYVRETASKVFKQANDLNFRGRNIDTITATTVYIACRLHKLPVTYQQIADISYPSKQDIARTSRYLQANLDLQVPPQNPKQYLPSMMSTVGQHTDMSPSQRLKVRKTAQKEINTMVEENIHIGTAPQTLVAGVVYAAIKHHDKSLITQQKLADLTDTSANSIRRYAKETTFY